MGLSCALVWLFLCATWAEEESVVVPRSRLKGVDLVDLEEEGMAVVEEVGGLGFLFIMEVATVFKEWDTMLVLEEVIMEVADLVELVLESRNW